MKRTLNSIYHGIGCMLICIGWILVLGAAGNNDLGVDLDLVVRLGICGMCSMLCGLFLTRWRV